MSYLFDGAQHILSPVTLLSDESDTAKLGSELCRKLVGDPPASPISLYVSPEEEQDNTHSIKSLAIWAVLDGQCEGLHIPPKWADTYKHIFVADELGFPTPALLSISKLILLTEVVLVALSEQAYSYCSQHPDALQDALTAQHKIIRVGDVLLFGEHAFRIDMTEPVLQGYASSEGTSFVLLEGPSQVSEDGMADIDSVLAEEEEAFEIGDNFLVGDLPALSQPVLANGDATSSTTPNACTLPAEPLRRPRPAFEDHRTIALRTPDLNKVGIFSGDWAVVHAEGSTKQRLVRVLTNSLSKNSCAVSSPILLHNVGVDKGDMSIRASPFGSREPLIPTAKAITVARIASRFSSEKLYEPLFLRALKEYFTVHKRLIKNGDIIPVQIDTDAARFEQDGEDGFPELPVTNHTKRCNEIVHFLITNVENNVLPVDEQDLYIGFATGELGCWVDPQTTRITQSGIERSRVPNLGSYMVTDLMAPATLYSRLPTDSALIAPGSPYHQLYSFCAATFAPLASSYNLELSVLVKGPRSCGKFTVISWVAQNLGMHLLEIDCFQILNDTDKVKTEATLQARLDRAKDCAPSIVVLRHVDAFVQSTSSDNNEEPKLQRALKDCLADVQQSWKVIGYPVIVIGTTTKTAQLPVGMASCFKQDVSFDAPSEKERYDMLAALLPSQSLAPDVSISTLTIQTAALVAADLVALVHYAQNASIKRALENSQNSKITDIIQAGVFMTAADFDSALAQARSSYSEAVGAPKIPNVAWDDVGGLANVKADIMDTIQLPIEHPELFADGLKQRSGILLYGPPGTGKTLLAKAVATSFSLNFFSVKGPELLNMYIGESEANVRRVFQRARDAKPCVVFFDELDSIAPKRGNQGDSGGVMDRIVSQLLAELDGMGNSGAEIFVMGATNRPDLLDPALLRPGRFDRMLYLGVSTTHEAQLNILEALTRKFRLDPDLSLKQVAECCPFNYTGADFYALCSDAMLQAMTRKAEELEETIARLNADPSMKESKLHPHPLTPQYYLAEMAEPEEISLTVTKADFEHALANLVPSVSEAEMAHYARIQGKFSNGNKMSE